MEVDGASAAVRDGRVAVRGSVGSVHVVRVRAGSREAKVDVVLADTGPLPDHVDLPASRGASVPPRPHAASPAAAPAPAPGPGPAPAKTAGGSPAIDRHF